MTTPTGNRLEAELHRVFGNPPVAPRAVMRVQVASGIDLQAGRDEADRFVDAGADLVVLDSDHVGPFVLAALALLLDLEPVAVVGTASAPDWQANVLATRSALNAIRPLVASPDRLLDTLGDPVLARLTGLLERLAQRRTPVLLGGGTATAAAALLATRLHPSAQQWWLAGSRPAHPAATSALQTLGLSPLLDLGVPTGGADLAVALVRTALDLAGA